MHCVNQKKLIELYGDYWHKGENPEIKKNYFKKFGFDTLIIWERELSNLDKLSKTVIEFNNK